MQRRRSDGASAGQALSDLVNTGREFAQINADKNRDVERKVSVEYHV